jgi:hypothetical protein
MSTGSKTLASKVTAVLHEESFGFLDMALETAGSTKQHKDHQALAWLAALVLRTQPDTAVKVAQRLLALPAVPLDCATRLVTAGMRVAYAQLLAAADSMIAGAEVWVQAQQDLGIQSDIPPAAVAICTGGDWVGHANCSCKEQSLTTGQI